MKTAIFKAVCILFTSTLFLSTVFGQSPNAMSYQAVIRNASNALVTNSSIGMQISILQGTTSGISVYTEKHLPTTNANGLVSIVIGAGSEIVSGSFASIDWTNGPYFIKTETDLNGGANYTITATSQLLSVPYALHAKTADSISGTISETDPIFESSVANHITASDTTKWNQKQDQLKAGKGISIVGDTIFTTAHYIGESFGGGIVFWVDASGQHGLIAATEDQSSGIQWYNGTFRYTGSTDNGLYAGEMNTVMIVATQLADNQTGNFAAKMCADYSVAVAGITYSDWYLPSLYEIYLLYNQKDVFGNFSPNFYWTSTEHSDTGAFMSSFISGGLGVNGKTSAYYVRAIRAF